MQADSSSVQASGQAVHKRLPGRIGHRALRVSDSIFLFGGLDHQGNYLSNVSRISCDPLRVDTLVTDNVLAIDGFSLFCFHNTIYFWGGNRPIVGPTNQLYRFDGTLFEEEPQDGDIPVPRSYHASAFYADKYLLVFGGSDSFNIFNDWYLLNMHTSAWRKLAASCEMPVYRDAALCWLNGRGILLLGEAYDPKLRKFSACLFFQVYMKDYQSLSLQVTTLNLNFGKFTHLYTYSSLCAVDYSQVAILGGERAQSKFECHNIGWLYDLPTGRLQRLQMRFSACNRFESIYYRRRMYLIGGYVDRFRLQSRMQVLQSPLERQHDHQRYLCGVCNRLFEQQLRHRDLLPIVREQYDYNYFLKMDNKFLAKFSTTLRNPAAALTLLVDTCFLLDPRIVRVSYHKGDYGRGMLRVAAEAAGATLELSELQKQFLLVAPRDEILQQSRSNIDSQRLAPALNTNKPLLAGGRLELLAMRFRLGALRIGPSCLCVVPSGLDDVLILYFSCWATYTPESKTASLDCNSYTLNRRTGSVSSPISRNIIFNNLKLYFSDPSEYEHHSFSLNVFNVSLLCRGYHSPLDLQVHSQESDNGLKCLHEQMRYMYLEGPKQTKVYLGEEQEFIFENIFTRLEEDTKKEMLSPISAQNRKQVTALCGVIRIYARTGNYFLRGINLYHHNRLLVQLHHRTLCGVIVLLEDVPVTFTRGALLLASHQACLRKYLSELKHPKRGQSA